MSDELKIKKPRGAASHKPGCPCKFCTRRKAKQAKVRGENMVALHNSISASEDEDLARCLPAVSVGKDPMDTTLEHFRCTRDPREVEVWKNTPELSPMNLPSEVRDKYPELAFKYLSKRKLDRLGMGHGGWEIFRDASLGYPEGVTRGNDMILGAMPKGLRDEIAQSRLDKNRQMVEGLEESQLQNIDRAAAQYRQADPGAEAGPLDMTQLKSGRVGGAGINVGLKRTVSGELLRERFVKMAEARSKHKKVFDLGKR